jgi:hypothetical protein
VYTGPFSFCLAWNTAPGFTALVLEHRASYLKSTSSSCLRFMLFTCGLIRLGSCRLLYLLYNFQQRIIMLVFFLVLVWLMIPIIWDRCCRHLAHGKFLTSVMSFVMGAGEARPFSQPSTGWNSNYAGPTVILCTHHSLCLLLPRCHKFMLVQVVAVYSTSNKRCWKAWTIRIFSNFYMYIFIQAVQNYWLNSILHMYTLWMFLWMFWFQTDYDLFQ